MQVDVSVAVLNGEVLKNSVASSEKEVWVNMSFLNIEGEDLDTTVEIHKAKLIVDLDP